MKLESIACNTCGAPLRVPDTANYATCNHCGSQLAVKRDEHVTYTEKIKEIDKRTEEMQDELDRLRIDNELAKLERNWDREKESFMIRDKDGHKRIPTTTGSVVVGVVVVLFGIFWTAMAANISRGHSQFGGGGISALFPAFGVLFILFGIGMSVYSYMKAKEYLDAERRYRQRRNALVDKQYESKRQRGED